MASITVTPDQDALLSEIHVSAPPERVFQAISDPQQLLQWWGQAGVYRCTGWESDLRVGGQWRSHGMSADGREFSVSGEFVEIDPPRVLAYTWLASWREHPPTVVRWELIPSSGGTTVRVRHSGFAGRPEAAADYQRGWPSVLGWMQSFVDKGETVDKRATHLQV